MQYTWVGGCVGQRSTSRIPQVLCTGFLLLLLLMFWLCVSIHTEGHGVTCVNVWTVSPPLLPLCRFQGSNSGVARLRQAPLPWWPSCFSPLRFLRQGLTGIPLSWARTKVASMYHTPLRFIFKEETTTTTKQSNKRHVLRFELRSTWLYSTAPSPQALDAFLNKLNIYN